jgi:DNA-binding PadR family transcriptional regulator
MTGYALREEIRDTLGHFWSESFGQIYPALADLERKGLVERRSAESSRTSKFAITEAGIQRLRELLAEPPLASTPRNGLMLRLFFGAQLGPEACRQLVLQAREQAERSLAEMQAAHAAVSSDATLAQAAPYILLTVSAGEHSARATIDWADETLTELSKLDNTTPSSPRPIS